MMNKKVMITALLAIVVMTGQSQNVKGLPDRVLNHKMDMTAPLPEPSFEIDTTTVRVHVLGWEAERPTKVVCLTVIGFFPYIAENYTGLIGKDGVAEIRFPQHGTSAACVSVDDGFSKHFYLWPGETADVYVDIKKMTEVSREYRKWQMTPKNYGFGQKDTLRIEQIKRQVVTEEYGFDREPALWFEGRYADLNTALHRYMPFQDGYGWDMDYERQLTLNRSQADTYADGMLAWRDHLKQRIASDPRLPLCAKQLCSLGVDVEAEGLLWGNTQMHDFMAAKADGDPSLFEQYREERPLSDLELARFRTISSNADNKLTKSLELSSAPMPKRRGAGEGIGTNTNYRAYFSGIHLANNPVQKYWNAISDSDPCDYLHDMRIVQNYPRHIALYGKLPEGAMDGVRMPYFHQMMQQLEAAEEGFDHMVYSDVVEDLQRRYKGKVVLIDFWATWCHGCIVMMDAMEPMKDTELNHPDLAFVYITDHTSPAARWQDFRNRIRGEHLRVDDAQMEALDGRFHIDVWPTYILMDRHGRCRKLDHNHVVDELLKELNIKK